MGRAFLGVRGWLAVSGILILLAGASLGFLGGSLFHQPPSYEEVFSEPSGASPVVDPSTPYTTSKVCEMLGMSTEQQGKLNHVLAEHFGKLKRLREEIDAAGARVEEEIVALLDEGQRDRWRQITREIKIIEKTKRVSEEVASLRHDLSLSAQEESQAYPIFLNFHLASDEYQRKVRYRRAHGEQVDHQQVGRYFAKLQEEKLESLRPILGDERVGKLREIEKRRWSPRSASGKAAPKAAPSPMPPPGDAGAKCPAPKETPAP